MAVDGLTRLTFSLLTAYHTISNKSFTSTPWTSMAGSRNTQQPTKCPTSSAKNSLETATTVDTYLLSHPNILMRASTSYDTKDKAAAACCCWCCCMLTCCCIAVVNTQATSMLQTLTSFHSTVLIYLAYQFHVLNTT